MEWNVLLIIFLMGGQPEYDAAPRTGIMSSAEHCAIEEKKVQEYEMEGGKYIEAICLNLDSMVVKNNYPVSPP